MRRRITFHRIFGFHLCKDGIWFNYKGDEVLRLWKKTKEGKRIVSLLFQSEFESLKELDGWWDEYRKVAYGKRE
jgi:hypothetical protein